MLTVTVIVLYLIMGIISAIMGKAFWPEYIDEIDVTFRIIFLWPICMIMVIAAGVFVFIMVIATGVFVFITAMAKKLRKRFVKISP